MDTKRTAVIVTDSATSHDGSTPAGSYLAIPYLASSLEDVLWRVIVFVLEGNGRLRPVNRPRSLITIPSPRDHSLLTIVDEIRPDALILCLTRRSLISLLKNTQRVSAPVSPRHNLLPLYVVAAPSTQKFVMEWALGAGMNEPHFFPRIGVARVSNKAKMCIVTELASLHIDRKES